MVAFYTVNCIEPLHNKLCRSVQPVAREVKFCGLQKGPDFKRVLPISVVGQRVVYPAELYTCSCSLWTNLVM